MRKLQSLRDDLAAHFQWLRDNPQALTAFVVSGNASAVLAEPEAPIGIGYAYTGRLIFLDFTGDLDEVMAVIWDWIRRNQPEIAQNPAMRERVRFEVELLDNDRADVQIDLALSEANTFTRREDGGFTRTPDPDPAPEPAYTDGPWAAEIDVDPLV